MDERQPHGSIPRQCTATSKRSGQRCRKSAMKGRTVCRAHGGATPRGIASPHFRHGRWSRDLPVQLADRYEAARQDQELLSVRDELALVDLRIGLLLAQVGDGQERTGDSWQEIGRLIEQRRRLAETEVRHRIHAGQMLAVEEALALAAALAAAVRRHVADPAAVAAIQRDLEGLLGHMRGAAADPALEASDPDTRNWLGHEHD